MRRKKKRISQVLSLVINMRKSPLVSHWTHPSQKQMWTSLLSSHSRGGGGAAETVSLPHPCQSPLRFEKERGKNNHREEKELR